MEFNKILKKQRNLLHLTLEDIGKYVGVSKATVQRWESGEIANIRRDKIYKLSQILCISPAELMGWEDYTPKTIDTTFCKRFKELAKQNNYAYIDIANFLNLPHLTLHMWVKGESEPSITMLVKIADFFNVSTDYLLGNTDSTAPSTESSEYAPKEQQLIDTYKALNDIGKSKAEEYLFDLAENKKYTK